MMKRAAKKEKTVAVKGHNSWKQLPGILFALWMVGWLLGRLASTEPEENTYKKLCLPIAK